jgi:hypothetical protein
MIIKILHSLDRKTFDEQWHMYFIIRITTTNALLSIKMPTMSTIINRKSQYTIDSHNNFWFDRTTHKNKNPSLSRQENIWWTIPRPHSQPRNKYTNVTYIILIAYINVTGVHWHWKELNYLYIRFKKFDTCISS